MSAQVTAGQIKELRDRTGVGMSKCKEALAECGGDMTQAIEYLRKKGIASAVKKEGRVAKEGVIATTETDQMVALVEVSAETDFVTQNEVFQAFIKEVAKEVASLQPKDVDTLLQGKYSKDPSITIDDLRAVTVQKVGENIQIRRFTILPKKKNISIGTYSHMGGRIVAVVVLQGASDQSTLAREIAMHVAASRPDYLNPDSVPEEVITKEREIAQSQIENKPPHVQEKILDGKIKAFFTEVCLTHQKYVRDDAKTVTEIVEERAKETGNPLSIQRFLCWAIGE